MGIRQLQRTTGLALATVQKHVHAIAEEGAIEIHRGVNGFVVGPRGFKPRPPPLDPHLEFLVALLRKNGPMRQVEVLELCRPIPRSTTQHRLKRLVAMGLVNARPGPLTLIPTDQVTGVFAKRAR
jgi:hypothetical protein